jgi:hypothetical protein
MRERWTIRVLCVLGVFAAPFALALLLTSVWLPVTEALAASDAPRLVLVYMYGIGLSLLFAQGLAVIAAFSVLPIVLGCWLVRAVASACPTSDVPTRPSPLGAYSPEQNQDDR